VTFPRPTLMNPPRPVRHRQPPPPPASVEEPEAAFWRQTVAEYPGLESAPALRLLEAACSALRQERICLAAVERDGVVVEGDRGLKRSNPLLREASIARSSFIAAIKALRLDITGPSQ